MQYTDREIGPIETTVKVENQETCESVAKGKGYISEGAEIIQSIEE